MTVTNFAKNNFKANDCTVRALAHQNVALLQDDGTPEELPTKELVKLARKLLKKIGLKNLTKIISKATIVFIFEIFEKSLSAGYFK